jgi:hypothetical protein
MEAEFDSEEVAGISVDSVLGELQSVLKGKTVDSDSSSESGENLPVTEKDSQSSPQEEKDDRNNKTDEEKIVEHSSVLSVSPNSYVDRPIFFKTSIKKDPGSKLHDQLVKELGSVLRKRNKENGVDPVKEEERKENRKPKPLKSNNSVFANKALIAHLENHLKKSLHKTTVTGKPRAIVNDSNFKEESSGLPNVMESSISGAAQFGVKLRPTSTRLSRLDSVELNGDISPKSPPPSLQTSQCDALVQAKASLAETKLQPKVLSQNSLAGKSNKTVHVTAVGLSSGKRVLSQPKKAVSVDSKPISSKSGDTVFHVATLRREGKHLTQITVSGKVIQMSIKFGHYCEQAKSA